MLVAMLFLFFRGVLYFPLSDMPALSLLCWQDAQHIKLPWMSKGMCWHLLQLQQVLVRVIFGYL